MSVHPGIGHNRAGQIVRLVILGQPVSKANSRKIVLMWRVKKNGQRVQSPAVVKSKEAVAYAASIARQVPALSELMTGELRVDIELYYSWEGPDLDASIILDGLQGLIYKNDRQVRSQHFEHHIDKANPRAVITIQPRDQWALFGSDAK